MPALATWTPEDALLSAVAPLGLGVAAPGPALVVDLSGDAAWPFATLTLAQLVADGPRRADLSPARPGVAVLASGGITPTEADGVLRHLVDGWPFVVLRMTPGSRPPSWPVIPVVPVLPGGLTVPVEGRVAYQEAGWGRHLSSPGPRLPLPRRGTWQALAEGRRPAPDRWIRALRRVWSWA